MALSKAAASEIVKVVEADVNCRNVILWNPNLAFIRFPLDFMQITGSIRNLWFDYLLGKKKMEDDEEKSSRICIGITMFTVIALVAALRQRKLPGVRSIAGISRVTGIFNVHHTATRIRMDDDSEYVFDWHATLQVSNPVISKMSDWVDARRLTSFHYVFFRGFK